jgi:dTDP-4-dehydrorhamnose reductase
MARREMSRLGNTHAGTATGRGHPSVLILGAQGMLGSACMRAFGEAAMGRDLADFDLSEQPTSRRAIRRLRPRLIINCAAATDVDRCETDHGYADRGNFLAAKHVAQAAAEIGARLLHVSTDFVFSGGKHEPYLEDDPPDPLNYYGRSKLAGERAVRAELPDAMIVRTSWLYGHGGIHFPGKVLEWAASGGPLRVVDDQIGSPTYADDLAESLSALVERNAPGIYHLGGAGCASRFEWAQETLALKGLDIKMIPVSSSYFPSPVPRPANSCLDCSKAARLGVRLPGWREGLARYVRSCGGSC